MYLRLAVACVLIAPAACRRSPEEARAPASKAPSATPAPESVKGRYVSMMNVGKAHYENGAADEAVAAFERAVELLPTEVAGHLNLARACILAGQFDRAAREANAAIQLDRYATGAYYLAGLAHLQLGDAPRAVAFLERAARDDPSVAAVQFQWGAALLMDGQSERAADAFRAALSIDPNHWAAHFRLASIARKAGDTEAYRQHMAEFQRLRENMPEQQQAPDFWQRCNFTVAEVPKEVHQPDAKPVPVRFSRRAWNVPNEGDDQFRPLAVDDLDNDGRYDVIVLDDGGAPRVVRIDPASFEASSVPMASVALSGANPGCRTADFDNDGKVDVLLQDRTAAVLLKQADDGSFADVTQTAGLAATGGLDAVWVDYDHDGDVDLLSAGAGGTLTLWQNRGNGTFSDVTAAAGIPSAARGVALWPADMDNDERIDVVVTAADGPAWQLHNEGLGEFTKTVADPPWPQGRLLTVEDLDNDLARDVVTADGNVVHAVLSGGTRHDATVPGGGVTRLQHLDYDNDGWLDLLVQYRLDDSGGAEALRLFRNAGAAAWEDVTEPTGLTAARLAAGARVLVADFDTDGDSDLLFQVASGTLTVRCNDGGNVNRQLKLRLVGTKSNRSALGTLIEASAGSFRLSRTVVGGPIEIGVGPRKKLDSVRTIWPNGIVKHDIWVEPGEPRTIEEPFVSAGSCPYLYAWDGRAFQFITDILGASPLGLPVRRGLFVPADTDEFVWVGNNRSFPPRGDRYVVQITDELREVLYLDHVALVAVDHPADVEVHPTNKLTPPPFVEADLWAVHDRKSLLRAMDTAGHDWTTALQEIDGVRSEPPALARSQLRGRAPRHSLELSFDGLDASRPLVLVLTGWLMWGDAGVNIAASQDPDLPDPWPTLDAWADGAWQPVPVVVGAPAGKSKTILVDLADRLPRGTSRLRLTTAYETYWDRVALFERWPDREVRRTSLVLAGARLFWRGYPVQIRPDRTHPVMPDVSNVRATPPWRRTLAGWCTAYGDVSALLTAVDDRCVVASGGDAVTIEFSDPPKPPPNGWTRDFFIYCDGWDKDGDYNVAHGGTVEPLPRHGMDDQRYGEPAPSHRVPEWVQRDNTRWVGP